jgi:PTS system sucrose-specific IIC component
MSNEKEIANKIIAYIGGLGNIVSISHCAVRLRLSLKNNSLLSEMHVSSSIPEVRGIIKMFGEHHFVVGPALVQKLYKEIVIQM